jgi:DNA-binding NarL/FixJ family response regulator
VSINVLVADDSDIMRAAIRRLLVEDGRIQIVGEASTFAQTMQLIGDCKPSVLLLDLHLPEQRDFTPAFVKSQLACVPHTLAVSLSNDDDAKALAASYGAEVLLDKVSLYAQMIPAIIQCCNGHTEPEQTLRLRKNLKPEGYTTT